MVEQPDGTAASHSTWKPRKPLLPQPSYSLLDLSALCYSCRICIKLFLSFPLGLCGCSPLLFSQRRGRQTICQRRENVFTLVQGSTLLLCNTQQILSVKFVCSFFLWLCQFATYTHSDQTVLGLSMSHQRWSLHSCLIRWNSWRYIFSVLLSAG